MFPIRIWFQMRWTNKIAKRILIKLNNLGLFNKQMLNCCFGSNSLLYVYSFDMLVLLNVHRKTKTIIEINRNHLNTRNIPAFLKLHLQWRGYFRRTHHLQNRRFVIIGCSTFNLIYIVFKYSEATHLLPELLKSDAHLRAQNYSFKFAAQVILITA